MITAAVKNGVVPFPDGTQRVLHCMESPEHWFEDFGAAKLKNGRAVVKLDADFAKVIKRGDYRYSSRRRAIAAGCMCAARPRASRYASPVAASQASLSPTALLWRKDIQRHKRFAKIDTRLPMPAARVHRRAPTLRAFRAELESEACAGATPAMRKSDSDFAAPLNPSGA